MAESKCNTALLHCVDFRVTKSDYLFMECFLNTIKDVPTFDTYAWPGSQKDVLDHEAFQDRFLELFKKVSIKHHGVRRLVLLMHWDCAGYGGLKDETIFRAELGRAKDFFGSLLPREVEIVFVYSKTITETPNMLRYVVL